MCDSFIHSQRKNSTLGYVCRVCEKEEIFDSRLDLSPLICLLSPKSVTRPGIAY